SAGYNIDFDQFVIIWMDLGFYQIESFIEIHDLVSESGRSPEVRALDHVARTITGFFFQFPEGALDRFLPIMQCARRNLQQLSSRSVPVLADQNDSVGLWPRYDADSAWMEHDFAQAFASAGFENPVLAHCYDSSLEE